MKAILKKYDDEYFALVTNYQWVFPSTAEYGETFDNTSAHSCRGAILRLPGLDQVRNRQRQYRATTAANYDRRHTVVEGSTLSAGDRLWIPDLQTEGNVKKTMDRIRNEYIRWTAHVGRFGGKIRETRPGGFEVYLRRKGDGKHAEDGTARKEETEKEVYGCGER